MTPRKAAPDSGAPLLPLPDAEADGAAGGEIPAYAGMTAGEAGMTAKEGGNDGGGGGNDGEGGRGARRRERAAMTPRKAAPDSGAPLLPLPRGSGEGAAGGEIPAYAGMTVRGAPLLLLMDGHAMVYRAWFALQQARPLTVRATGEDVRGVYSFTTTFFKTLADHRPTHAAIRGVRLPKRRRNARH